MLASTQAGRCEECLGEIVDTGDELVCRSCGVVTEKEVLEAWGKQRAPQAIDYTAQALGGYLGSLEHGYEERFSRAFSRTSSNFEYLKLISDYSGREDSTIYACVKMIERVCEKLSMPSMIVGQAVVIAKKLFVVKRQRNDITSAAVSAYAIITASKIGQVTSVGVKEIIEAHRLMGRRVKMSALIQLSLNSPIKMLPRKPEDYVGRVIARLSSKGSLAEDLASRGINGVVYLNALRVAAKEALAAVEQPTRGGHSPCTLAATAVYAGEVSLAKKESRKRLLSQKDVAESVDVAEYTVREQYGEIFRPMMQRQ
jgi:transcription initiation factor TFIIIB Brf1 subunit/transcription initiation factor TFIIB